MAACCATNVGDYNTNKNEAEEAIERFDYVRFTFADINGIARSKTVVKQHFTEFFADGITMFAGILALGPRSVVNFVPNEVTESNLGNMVVKPVPGTLHSLPWATEGKHRVGEVFCETFWLSPYRGGSRMNVCPRYVARRQLDRLTQLGYQLYSGFEAEFLVRDAELKPIFGGHHPFVNNLFAEFESFIYSMNGNMAAAGVDVTTIHTEFGAGQFEMVMAPKYGIEVADQMFLLKQAIKEMTRQCNGWQATFMSQPFVNVDETGINEETGNGLHFSHSLWSITSSESSDKGPARNLFYDPVSEDGLSKVAHHWIAGLLKHGPALMALCSPTVNCYRRLGTIFTPTYFDWGMGYRCGSICAKTGHPTATYLENRLPGGAANSYLVLAATVAAGIDGIVNELECPARMTMSQREATDKDQTAPDVTTSTNHRVPKNLSESLAALEGDAYMCQALGEDFVHWFVSMKKANEIDEVAKAIESGKSEIDMEREMYFQFM